MNKSNQRGISIKGKFKCSFCESDHCASLGSNQPLQYQVNHHVKNFLASIPQVYCTNHPNNEANLFCPTHQDLVCYLCMMKHHSNHVSDCKEVVHDAIGSFFEKALGKLHAL